MIPATPPSCSITFSPAVRSATAVCTSPSTASAVSPASVARVTEGASPLNFVVRFVNRPVSVLHFADPALDTQGTTLLHTGNPARPQPHHLDGVGSVEQFGTNT